MIGPTGVTASTASRTIGSTAAGELHAEGLERLGALDDGGGALVEEPAGVGERGAVLRAVEERHAELVLQVAHELAHGGLRLVERVRRRRERALVGDRQERDELIVGHGLLVGEYTT